MNRLNSGLDALSRSGDLVLPTLARFVFAAVLLGYFWSSAITKFDGVFTPSIGAYAQIYPRAIDAVSYDASRLGLFPHLVVLFGGWAEFALPALLALGLCTRVAAVGMIGFVTLQSLTDIFGHMVDADTIGAWFDHVSDALILDQRAFWMLCFAILALKGGGPIALDRLIWRRFGRP